MKQITDVLKHHWILLIILLLAAFLRLYQLDSVPPSASLDEVSIGWNAYSVLKTGRDEYGTLLPVTLRAYDDFRPALYVYLVAPFVWVFGLSPLAVRLPAVLLSILSIFATYVLANSLLRVYVLKKNAGGLFVTPGHIAALLLAISPWHIYLSRLGHEGNAGLSFLILAATLFFLGIAHQKKKWLLPVSALFFALSFGSYQSEKVVLPLLVGGMGLIFLPVIKDKRNIIVAAIIGITVALPTVATTLSREGMIRFAGTSAFSASDPLYEEEKTLFMISSAKGDLGNKLIHHPRLTSLKIFTKNYFLHFQPTWLFSGGPLDQHKVPYTGLLYWWEFPFILLGLLYLLTKRTTFGWVILLWLLTAPLPAAITTQAPHALRSFTFLPSWQLIEAVGVFFLFAQLKNIPRVMFLIFLAGMAIGTTVGMYDRYMKVFPKTQSESFGYALHNAVGYVKNNYSKETPVTITPVVQLQTYMFYLFDMNYDPQVYQSYGGTKSGGLGTEFVFGKVRIENFSGKPLEKGRVYIGNKQDFPPDATIKYEALYLDGVPGAYVGVSNL